MKTIITFILVMLFSATTFAQCALCKTCSLCEGSGSVWGRERGFQYNDVVLQRDGTYTYGTKNYRSKRVQSTCPICGGAGYIQPQPKPKPTYYTGRPVRTFTRGPKDIDAVLKKDFYLATNWLKVDETVYRILQEKEDHKKYSLVMVTGDLTYKTLASHATDISAEEDEYDQFIAFRVYTEGGGTQYLNADGSRLYSTSKISHLASPEGYLWVHEYKQTESREYYDDLVLKEGKPLPYYALYDGRNGKKLLPEEYSPHDCRCIEMWERDGMIDVSKLTFENERWGGYRTSVGIVNKDNEVVIPAEYNRVDSCLNNGIITMVDKNFLVRTFDKTGLEIEPPLEEVKTCPDGNKLVRSKFSLSEYSTKTKRMERRDIWIHELFSADMQPLMPSVMESCGCYNEHGWAEVVPVNSEDRFLLHRDGRMVLNPNSQQPMNFMTKHMSDASKATRVQIQSGLETGIMHTRYQNKEQRWASEFDRFQYFSRIPNIPTVVDQGDASCTTLLTLADWIRGRREVGTYSKKMKNGECACTYHPESTELFDKCSPSGIVEKKGKLGYVLDKYSAKSKVVSTKYKSIYPVKIDKALIVQDFDGKWGIIDIGKDQTSPVIKCSYDAIYSLDNNTYLGLSGGSYYHLRDINHPSRKMTIEKVAQLSPHRKRIIDLNERFPAIRGVDISDFLKGFSDEQIAQMADFKITYGLPKAIMQDGRIWLLIDEHAVLLDKGLVDAGYSYKDSHDLTSMAVKHKNGKWGLIKYNHDAKKEEVIFQQVVNAETGYDDVQLFYFDNYYDPLPVFSNQDGYFVLRNYRPFNTALPNNTTIPFLIKEK